jgi:hypothetical protein
LHGTVEIVGNPDEANMSNPFDNRPLTTLEEQAYTEASEYLAEQLKQVSTIREAVQRLERNLAVMALAADMAASASQGNLIQVDGDGKWFKAVDFMDNTWLCHRLMDGRVEYAIVEHFPARGTNEIWNRGRNAVEVLKVFAGEQERALKIEADDLNAQVKKFLAQKHPGQDMSRVAASFTRRFTHAIPYPHFQNHRQNHSGEIRI